MTPTTFEAIDTFFARWLLPADDALDRALEQSAEAGLPAIHVAPNQGKLLMLLARAMGARRILEVGTLGGYSTIWLGRALPEGGQLITLEREAKHAEVARTNLERAGLMGRVELREGPALETLPQLEAEGGAPFDLCFIDADKPSNPDYFHWALRLSRVGSVIIVDNVVRGGAVVSEASDDPRVRGVRALLDLVAAEPRVDATVLQTVGSKGHDGWLVALVVG